MDAHARFQIASRGLASVILALALHATLHAGEAPDDLAHQVRKILSNSCFKCHGPDAANRQADLRLDRKESALAPLDSGATAIVPFDADNSALWARVTADDPFERMPPADSGIELTSREIDLLRRWIDEGAPWQEHWAFVPPVRPRVPRPRGASAMRNPIDAFVLARLEREGMQFSPAADRRALLRRLSLDLVGLTPSIDEIDAFIADSAQGAVEREVERLLQSPHYGERWARLWLDAARYADSDGYEKDKSRQVWFYRDWVVGALNRDLPYDQFVIQQIAGDLLPRATQDELVATGFLRNSMINEEGGIDPEQFRMEAMFDRMDAIGKSVLGLTIQCCQCHDHKFDPISQREYFQLFAFLNNTHEANIAVYSREEDAQRRVLAARIAQIEAGLKEDRPDWIEQMAAWAESVERPQTAWTVVRPKPDATGGQKHHSLEDGSILALGYAPTRHTTQFTADVPASRITAIRLELLNDPNLPLGGPGRSTRGLCALTEFQVVAAPLDEGDKPRQLKFSTVTADVSPPERHLEAMFDDGTNRRRVTGPAAFANDGLDETAWSIDIGPARSNVPRQAVFVLDEPLANRTGWSLTFKLVQNHGGANSDDNQNNNLGRFRFSITGARGAEADPIPADVRAAMAVPRADRTPRQTASVFSYWRTTAPAWQPADDEIESLWAQHPSGSSQLVLAERDEPRVTYRLERGDFLHRGEPVTPGVPALLHALAGGNELSLGSTATREPPSRLDFARWLVDRRSPTAARVIVNRVWQAYFGTGLVATSEDFGSQSEAPSHRELLDWLAVEFMDRGWSLKELHRLITSSVTYQQQSRVTRDQLARDPANRLLARGPRFRVDAELVRDVALAASGLLNPKLGGPSVYPPAPEFLFVPPASYGPKKWDEAHGDDRYRRALYTFRFRSVPYPVLQTFDAPNGEASCVRRARSNTPLQALATLNEPLFLECARELARRTLCEGGSNDEQRLAYAFRRCVARPPSTAESDVLLTLLRNQIEQFSAPMARPWELAANDPNRPPELPSTATPAELAAWTAVSRVMLNLDETISKE